MAEDPSQDMAISERLHHLATEAGEDAVSLGWVMDRLNERAFGLFLLILALPCCIPFLYGVPQIVALPLMFVSVQLLMGRNAPWLPERLSQRTVTAAALTDLATRADPWLRWIEKLSRPRLTGLTRPPVDRFLGLALVLFSASILVPLPATNTVPGMAVAVIAIGLLLRDGVLVILGAIMGTAWIATLIFAGATLASIIRGWIGI
ncbi:MAG: exopolysaccharide biosynthesis protein [Rhodobacteraceae bacterium]|nr:exopolysaccharide biosynthesis protein [Paracoccaceae bacterium]